MWSLLTPLYSWWIKNVRGPFDIFFHGLHQLYTSVHSEGNGRSLGSFPSRTVYDLTTWGPYSQVWWLRSSGLGDQAGFDGEQTCRQADPTPPPPQSAAKSISWAQPHLVCSLFLLRPREESCGTCLRPVTARPASPGLSSFSSRQVEALSPPRQQVGDKLTIPLPF